MSIIKIVNNHVENKFPTLNKTWDGTLYKKIGFVFFSVLTAGILPLSLIIYDAAKDLIYGRNKYSVLIFSRWSFSVPDKLSRNFKAIAISSGVIGTVSALKKFFNIDLISPLTNRVSEKISPYITSFKHKVLVSLGIVSVAYIFKKSVEHYRYVMDFRAGKEKRSAKKQVVEKASPSKKQSPSNKQSTSMYPRLTDVYSAFSSVPSAPTVNPRPEGQ